MEFVRWIEVFEGSDVDETSLFDDFTGIVAAFWCRVSDSLPQEYRFRSTKTPEMPFGPE
jgi:hypothetical protein